ncbi:hypothetical protein K490DRAFT_39877 [Saccharata proteae CBS 121410]|uniref:tRNA (guanine(37)-N1)-methyltransferase n=1 Tax=Saccharata proteae CBS 121410 TaxID=1314787 RepID=A0A9P4LW71_9PEZI|nr:hypothetical protein K490DRAFT_39877 [Saccharata proteae CBS 121410]
MVIRPPINRTMRSLDRAFFKKTWSISAARIFSNKDISPTRKSLEKSGDLLNLSRVSSIVQDPDADLAAQGRKCIMLRDEIKHNDHSTWGPILSELHKDGKVGVIPYTLTLDYDHWTYEDIMTSILPEENQEHLFPSRFTQVGHLIHVNIHDTQEPYKYLSAQVLVDKCHHATTVINKIDNVGDGSEFRTFSYEVLAGVDDPYVEVCEGRCRFRLDYSKVYWNARLEHEHSRLISKFKEGQAVCDVMAGIGPFAIPAGKKKVFVWANDLNPMSYKYMKEAKERNKVGDFVQTFNMDGNVFIREATAELRKDHRVIPIEGTRKMSPRQFARALSQAVEQPPIFSHYIMNLPASAIEFLPAFIGLYNNKNPGFDASFAKDYFERHPNVKLPMIHVYCFGPKKEMEESEQALHVCRRISEQLKYEITPETPECEIYDVRDVAPNKKMFCASFRLPEEVAFREG